MKSLKTSGLVEVQSVRRRALRLCAMDRLSKEDADKVVEATDALEAVILATHEEEEVQQ